LLAVLRLKAVRGFFVRQMLHVFNMWLILKPKLQVVIEK